MILAFFGRAQLKMKKKKFGLGRALRSSTTRMMMMRMMINFAADA